MSDKWDLPEGQTQYNPKDLSKHIVHKEPYVAHVTEPHHKTELVNKVTNKQVLRL